MRRSIAATLFALGLLIPHPALAHPGAGIVVDRIGRVYFVVPGRNSILLIDERGRLGVFLDDIRLSLPHHLVFDRRGDLYTISDNDGSAWRISADGRMTRVLQAPIGSFGDPFTLDSAGVFYSITSGERARVVRVTQDGRMSPLAGGAEGYADGVGAVARFGGLHFSGMVVGPDAALYVTDDTRVRRVAPDGAVSTVRASGLDLGMAIGIAVDAAGTLYVADYRNRRVVKIQPNADATELAGSAGLHATGVTLGQSGETYVLDNPLQSTRVWRIDRDGSRRQLVCVNARGNAFVYSPLAVAAVLLLALAFGRAPTRRNWIGSSLATGLIVLFAAALVRGSCASGAGRYLLGPLFVLSVAVSMARVRKPAHAAV